MFNIHLVKYFANQDSDVFPLFKSVFKGMFIKRQLKVYVTFNILPVVIKCYFIGNAEFEV